MDEDSTQVEETTESTQTTDDVNEGSAEETASTASSGDETDSEAKATEEKPENYDRRLSKFKDERDTARTEAKDLRGQIEKLEGGKQTATQQQQVSPQIAALKDQLKQLGFVDKTEMEADLRQRDEDAQVRTEIDRLNSLYDGKDGRPKFNKEKVLEYALENQVGNLEAAYKLKNEKKLIDWQIKQASSKTKGIKTEASTGTGSQEASTTDEDLKAGTAKGDKDSLHAYLKRRIKVASKT